ncbi:urokinase plasminogen activator surface receptor-like isoform X2 [Scyliorhinus canicula]|uniref:urokinase plasminogen activator surface receptor-like isoform X2 n=1 Tax=Scyliorhinus canicula TaxID=7830 RepID=UPI0018F67029|nr:urokinase plasminogen activator surface receptor-like isoform X2 [Scyliorhinus canicula]
MMKLFSGIFIICALVTEGNYSQRMVCKPAENLICITIEITTGDAGQHAFVKGCLSESTCQSPKTSFFGVQNSSDIQCCQGNLCNKETTLPGQQCHSCFGESGVCSSKPIQCISSSCTTASIKEVINGTSQEYLLKGCGNCFGSLSFNAGPFSVERADRCCQSDNCNNQTVAVEVNTTLNGLMCYGCTPYSNQKCSDAKTMVNCVGKQTRCLHSSTTGHSNQNVIIKGCASESICNNPDVLKFYELQPKQDFYCCKGSGCNLENWSSRVSTEKPTASSNTVAVNNSSPTAPTSSVQTGYTVTMNNISSTVQTSSVQTSNSVTMNNTSSTAPTSSVQTGNTVTMNNTSSTAPTSPVQTGNTVTMNNTSSTAPTSSVQTGNTVTMNNTSSTAPTSPVQTGNTVTMNNTSSTEPTLSVQTTNSATVNNSSPAVYPFLVLPVITLIPCLF